jgi:WD40 repeat protein
MLGIKLLRVTLRSRFTVPLLFALVLVAAVWFTPRNTDRPEPWVMTFQQRYAVPALVFSPDGRTLAAGGGRPDTHVELTLCDLVTGEQRTLLRGPGASVEFLAYDVAGPTLVALHYDGTVRRWDLATGRELAARRAKQCGLRGALSPDGRAAAWPGLNDKVHVWDLEAGKLRATLPISTKDIWAWAPAWAPDNKMLAAVTNAGNKQIRLCNLHNGQVQFDLRDGPGLATRLAFSPDGHRLAVGVSDGSVEVWGTRTGQCTWSCRGHEGAVYALVFSPDGSRLASGGQDGSIRLWDPATGESLGVPGEYEAPVSALAFSPDGTRLASGASNGQVILWDLSMVEGR